METIPAAPLIHTAACPPPLPPPPPRGPRLGAGLLVCLIYFVAAFGVTIPPAIYFALVKQPVDPLFYVLLSQVVGFPVAMLAGLRITRRTWGESFAIQGCSWRLLPGLVIGCFGLSMVLNRLASQIPMPEFFETVFEGLTAGNPALMLISLTVLAPLTEELFFRGWMLRGFLANYSARKSIWLTAVIFALFHLNPWQAVVALPLGLLFAWLVLRTGSLLPGLIGHFVVNFTATQLLQPYASIFGHSAEALEEATHLPWDMVVSGAVMMVLGLGWLWRALRPGSGEELTNDKTRMTNEIPSANESKPAATGR